MNFASTVILSQTAGCCLRQSDPGEANSYACEPDVVLLKLTLHLIIRHIDCFIGIGGCKGAVYVK